MEQKIMTEKLATQIYQSAPPKPFDIEGTILKKDGKNITLKAEIEGKEVEMEVKLKDEITENTGDKVKIEKENIVAYKRKAPLGIEGAYEGDVRDIENILEELGLPLSSDNIALLEHLIKIGLTPDKETALSFLMSSEMLKDLRENLDVENITKLTLEGMDLEHENLQKIADRIHEIKNIPEKKKLSEILGFKKPMTDEEAENISREIYGTRMGKDYYDAIKSLAKYDVEISRDRIEKIISLNQKIHELKNVESASFVSLEQKKTVFNIENLYKEFKNYNVKVQDINGKAKVFDDFAIKGNSEIEGARNLLKKIGMEESPETLELVRAFIVLDVDVTEEKANKVIKMKEDFNKIQQILDEDKTSELLSRGIDAEKTEISELLEIIESGPEIRETPEPLEKITPKPVKFLNNQVSFQKLTELLKNGEDFTLESLKKVEEPVILNRNMTEPERAAIKIARITEMFAKIGEIPRKEVIEEANKNNDASLKKLYDAEVSSKEREDTLIHKVSATDDFVTKEYLRMKKSISAQVVRISIAENVEIENLPLREANDYIENKLKIFQRVKEIQANEISEKLLLPIIYKNGLELNLQEISDISSFLRGDIGINKALENLDNHRDVKEKAKNLTKEISDSLKEGEDFRESYRELINLLSNPEGNTEGDGENAEYREPEFLKVLRRISRGTRSLQLPLEIEGEMNNLNIFMPKKSEKKTEINFFMSLNTETLGNVEIAMTLRGRNLILKRDDIPEDLQEFLPEYEAGLNEKGYNLILKSSV